MQLSFAALVLSLTAAVSAAPNQLLARNEEATCGNKVYKADEVAAAMKAACKHIADGTNAGSSSYPHKYNNFEGFEFKGLDGPFEEFPMISGKVYTGGSPGPDRVVVTQKDCKLAGSITHTGADGNNFVACKGTS